MKYPFYFFTLLFFTNMTLASGNHTDDINNNEKSKWQADFDLMYREKSQPNILGFMPTNAHQQSAGISLNHADVSYQTNLASDILNGKQSGRIALSYHSGDVELSEAWLNNAWQKYQLNLTAGKFLPRIGFLNHQHQHAQTLPQPPLINRIYWGDQLSEAGVALEWQPNIGKTQLRQTLNLLGGEHLNSKKNTLAALYQVELSRTIEAVTLTTLLNAYYTEMTDRGLFLFDLSNNTHTHSNSTYTEYFDGNIMHLGAGIKLVYTYTHGEIRYLAEYAHRQERGELYNISTTNASNTLADLSLNSHGHYQQLSWHNAANTWQLATRFDYLYSGVKVTNTSDNSLDNSRLNNQGATPKRISLMLGYQFASKQGLQLIYSEGINWEEYPSQLAVHFQQSLRF